VCDILNSSGNSKFPNSSPHFVVDGSHSAYEKFSGNLPISFGTIVQSRESNIVPQTSIVVFVTSNSTASQKVYYPSFDHQKGATILHRRVTELTVIKCFPREWGLNAQIIPLRGPISEFVPVERLPVEQPILNPLSTPIPSPLPRVPTPLIFIPPPHLSLSSPTPQQLVTSSPMSPEPLVSSLPSTPPCTSPVVSPLLPSLPSPAPTPPPSLSFSERTPYVSPGHSPTPYPSPVSPIVDSSIPITSPSVPSIPSPSMPEPLPIIPLQLLPTVLPSTHISHSPSVPLPSVLLPIPLPH
jgi:hypothetical protein